MANITRIKAGAPTKPSPKSKDKPAKKAKKSPAPQQAQNTDKIDKSVEIAKRDLDRKLKKDQKRAARAAKTGRQPVFFLFVPFVAFGHYLKDAWHELRQVRWPNAKLTWKMVLAVFVYTLIFVAFLVALDLLFDWLFSLILK